jgi:hypothetical protein
MVDRTAGYLSLVIKKYINLRSQISAAFCHDLHPRPQINAAWDAATLNIEILIIDASDSDGGHMLIGLNPIARLLCWI